MNLPHDSARSLTRSRAMVLFAAAFTLLFMSGSVEAASNLTAAQRTLVAALQQGGNVLVFRHADSPSELPDAQTAEPDNSRRERQLSAAGKAGSTAMGAAVQRLRIPVGEVLVSTLYRTQQTARLAGLPNLQVHEELSFGGTDMSESVTPAQAAWLKARATMKPARGNTFIVTHSPNLAQAFPELIPALASGEAAIFAPDGRGGARLLGRLKLEEWAGL